MEIIKMEKICKVFGKNDTLINALDNITLNIEHGDLIAIVGPSGCGKSTLLNIIGLLDNFNSGKYYLNDIEVSSLKNDEKAKLRNKYLGFVVQNFSLIKDYNVRENIEIPLEYSKVKKEERKKRVDELAKLLKIDDKLKKYPNELSGGQQQRVAIARAIVNNPEVILADEPTGALDKENGQAIMNIFKELNEKGKTILIVTHDMNIAKQCKKVIHINDGKI